nr:H-2 class I histocompatibility antigen, Q7 alpha chain-like isoform X2 [Nerophis lumbriciformis]
MNLFLFFLLVVQMHSVTPVIHTLQYFYTASSQVPNFPEFVSVGYVDGVEISYYDSNIRKAESKQDWMNKITAEDPKYWQRQTEINVRNEFNAKHNLEVRKKRFNQTGELPEVFLLQKTPSSPVTCMATGFYPDLADLFWRKDGEQIFEDVEHGELLPNHDGTFQMSVELKVEVTAEVEGKYECVFQLSGVKEDLVTKLERRSILSNASHEDNWSVALAATAAVVAVAAVLAAIIIVMVRRHRNRQARHGGVELSERVAAEG